jgi:membrane protease YdiL (CAAX protease family)
MWLHPREAENRGLKRWVQSLGGFPQIPLPRMPNQFVRFLLFLNSLGMALSFKIASALFTAVNALTWHEFKFVQISPASFGAAFGKSLGDTPVKQDGISILFTVIAATELVFFSTFQSSGLQTDSLIAEGIMFAGLLLQSFLKFDINSSSDSRTKDAQILTWTIIDIALFYAINISVSAVPLSLVNTFASISFTPQRMFLLLIAVAEEQFFRGFLLNLFLNKKTGQGIAVMLESAIFALYHSYVYGGDTNALLIVFGAGLVISYGDIKTGRVSTGIASHVLNNLLASG